MALTYPLDLLAGFPGWTTQFEPLFRQELSRQANGRTRSKDLGSPLWMGAWQSRSLSPNELDYWRARLEAMEGGIKEFLGYSLSRCRPIAHPGNAALPIGTLSTIADRKTIRVDGLTGITLSVGDLIRIGTRNVHRVQEPATGPLTALFEVRPHLWPETVTGDTVTIERPSCPMTIVAGSVSSPADPATGRGVVSFQAIESR